MPTSSGSSASATPWPWAVRPSRFRCFLLGNFEGIDSERGIAYRVSDPLGLREFFGLSLEGRTPAPS